jgi:hypothetical protein
MRSYIFTERERRIIQGFLRGKVKSGDPGLMVIVSRLKSFTDLARDVQLYIRLREAISTASA